MRKAPLVAVVVLLVTTAFIVSIGSSLIISSVYNVPLWYLTRVPPESSLLPSASKMNVSITPTVPLFLGDSVTVSVIDAYNGTPIKGAIVQISRDGTDYAPKLTDNDGKTIFEYPGEPTIIEIFMENYVTVDKVIPRIPDQWLRAEFANWVFNIATIILGLSSTSLVVIKFRDSFFPKKKRNKKQN